MTIKFIGDEFSSTERIVTQCHSLDLALSDRQGNTGIPLRSIIETYGGKNVGKSTFCFSLLGMIASKLQRNITILDWEGQNKETIEGTLEAHNFFGSVNYLLNKGTETSEETLERFVSEMMDEGQNIGMMDSIGGFIPTAYSEGGVGDSNMGVFAREIGRFTSKLNRIILRSDEPGIAFLTNHVHPTIGSMVQGQSTSGGETKKYLAHVRIDLKRAYIGNSPVNFGESYLLKGKIDSNRFGFSGREFYVFIIAGEGIHIGLTAVWDCVIAGHATLSAKSIKDSVVINLDGQSFGKMRGLIENRNDKELFVPFVNKLREGDFVSNEEESTNLDKIVDELESEMLGVQIKNGRKMRKL